MSEPAFPSGQGDYWRCEGMTMRDYFAAKAMQGLMARVWADDHGKVPSNIFEIWAKSAYGMADAMLAQRDAAEEKR